MLPAVAEKIDSMSRGGSKKKRKKSKKTEKSAKKSKKSKRKRCTSSNDSSSEDERIPKKKRKKRKHFSDAEISTSSTNESESANEWVEKVPAEIKPKVEPDDWMGGLLLPTYSKNPVDAKKSTKKYERKDIDSYNPSKSALELNPYWKDGGKGLPTFQKPADDSDGDDKDVRQTHVRKPEPKPSRHSNWRKRDESTVLSVRRQEASSSSSESGRSPSPENTQKQQNETSRSEFLTDQQMNELGAKILKAEIMGNEDVVNELRAKLERARQYRVEHKKEFLTTALDRRQQSSASKNRRSIGDQEATLLTSMNREGMSRPVTKGESERDAWGGSSGRKAKKVETHSAGERVRYFADDDKYDIKQMVNAKRTESAAAIHLIFSKLYFTFTV